MQLKNRIGYKSCNQATQDRTHATLPPSNFELHAGPSWNNPRVNNECKAILLPKRKQITNMRSSTCTLESVDGDHHRHAPQAHNDLDDPVVPQNRRKHHWKKICATAPQSENTLEPRNRRQRRKPTPEVLPPHPHTLLNPHNPFPLMRFSKNHQQRRTTDNSDLNRKLTQSPNSPFPDHLDQR
jgi:hypothetical protein